MKYIIEKSFERDAKKLDIDLLHEIQDVVLAIRQAQTLAEIPFSIKKMSGYPKLKAFRLKFNRNKDFRLGFYLEEDTLILSRVLSRKEIYKMFP
jgi:mRNA interferase RelE/StbE